MVSDALGMISGGRGDHAVSAFFWIERQEFVQRAALFESSGALLVVELQEDGIVGESGECFGVRAGRDSNVIADSFERGLNVGKLDHGREAVILADKSFNH